VRRRDLLAGLASVGALGGAGAVATGRVPDAIGGDELGGSEADGDRAEPIEPVTLDTVEAPGSRDGEVTLPMPDRPTFVDFFGTWCPPAKSRCRLSRRPTIGSATRCCSSR